jgi:hypothetical protein
MNISSTHSRTNLRALRAQPITQEASPEATPAQAQGDQFTFSGSSDLFSRSNLYTAGGLGIAAGGFAVGLKLGNALGVAVTVGALLGGSMVALGGALPQGNWS